MDGLKTYDYFGICRLCLCKGNQANQICATQDNVDVIKLVYDCTSILLNTDELLPHNICHQCANRLTDFKTFRDCCLKNDELIRLHSLIHCDDGDISVRPDGESGTDNVNADDLQDIADYVREELQEELYLKSGDFVFGTNSVGSEGYAVNQGVTDGAVGAADIMVDEQGLVATKRKRRRSKETISEVAVETYQQSADEIQIGSMIGISIETLDEIVPKSSLSTETDHNLQDIPIGYVDMDMSVNDISFAAEYLINDDEDEAITLLPRSDSVVTEVDAMHDYTVNDPKAQSSDDDDDVQTPPMSPEALALYRRRKRNVPKSGHKYLIDQTLEKPKYYYYVTTKCDLCDAVLPRKDMKYHMNDHNGLRPYACDQCDKAYSSPWKRTRHIKVVHVDQLLACDQCGVTFKCKINLARHLRTSHASAASTAAAECTVCDRKFSCRDSLKRHMMVHTGERPYVCTICSKTFTNTFNLKTHLRRHTQEKPYKCELCGCAFGYPGVLKNHLEKVHKRKATGSVAPRRQSNGIQILESNSGDK